MDRRESRITSHDGYPADLAIELPTSTLADAKHTKGDDSPTAIFPTARTTSYPYTPPTARFETPASPEAAVDESDPSVQAAINQEYINSLSTRGEELSLLGRLTERVGVGLSCAAIGISALAMTEFITGYGVKWESDESANLPTLTIESPNTTEVTDPADIANLNRQRGQEAYTQYLKASAVGTTGAAFTYTARRIRKKSAAYSEKATAIKAKMDEE